MIKRIRIYAFCPALVSEVGHHFFYHQAVSKSAKKNQFLYVKFVSKHAKISLTQDWKKKFSSSIFSSFFSFLFLLGFLIRKGKKRNHHQVFFGEYLGLLHQLALFLAIVIFQPKGKLWLLQRYERKFLYFGGYVHAFFYRCFRRVLKENFVLLADTEMLAKEHNRTFHLPCEVLPIPHEDIWEKEVQKGNFWLLPGGSARKEKGIFTVLEIAQKLEKEKSSINIFLSEEIKEMFLSQKNCLFFSKNLPRDEYKSFMQKALLILLPYEESQYQCRSSGIFIEAVVSGNIPVTTEGTWMAYELKKFGLEKLCFFWKEEHLIEMLEKIPNDLIILEKLSKMCEHYRSFHTIEEFASTMKRMTY